MSALYAPSLPSPACPIPYSPHLNLPPLPACLQGCLRGTSGTTTSLPQYRCSRYTCSTESVTASLLPPCPNELEHVFPAGEGCLYLQVGWVPGTRILFVQGGGGQVSFNTHPSCTVERKAWFTWMAHAPHLTPVVQLTHMRVPPYLPFLVEPALCPPARRLELCPPAP